MPHPSDHRCAACGKPDQPLINCGCGGQTQLLCYECRQRRYNVPTYRRTGRTTRTLWAALLHASGHERADVVVFVDRAQIADWTYGLLCRLTETVGECVRNRERRTLRLPNMATVQIAVTPRRMDEEARYHGRPRFWSITDHGVL